MVNKRLSISYSPISESNANKELYEQVMQTAQTFFKEHMSLENISEANISEAQVADYPVTKQTGSSTSTVTCYTSPIMSSLPSYITNSQSRPIIRQSVLLVNQKHDLSIHELKYNGPHMNNRSSEFGAIPKVPQSSSHKSQEVSFSPYSTNFDANKIGQISRISGKLNTETYSRVSTGGMPNDFTHNAEFVGTKFIPNPRNCEAAWANNNLNSKAQFLGSFTQGLTNKMNDFSPFSNSAKPKLSSNTNSNGCTCSCGKDILSERVASATLFAPRTSNFHKNNNQTEFNNDSEDLIRSSPNNLIVGYTPERVSSRNFRPIDSIKEPSVYSSGRINGRKVDMIVRQWGITFSGDNDTSAENFLTRIEECRSVSGLTDEELLIGIPFILDKLPLQWFRNNSHAWPTWNHFRSAFLSRFGDINYQWRLEEQVATRYQGADERTADYLTCLQGP